MANPVPIPPIIPQLTAPLLVGALVNYAFYGILVVQACIYHIAFPEDRKRFKFLVLAVLIIETVQVCLSASDVYYWFASGFGDVVRLGNVHFSSFSDPLLCAVSSLIAQLFFCYRIWSLRKGTLWLTILISCISVLQLVAGILGSIRGVRHKTFANGTEDKRNALMWLLGNAVADLLIAASLTFLLLRQRSQDQPWTNKILIRLVRLVMETNCLTSAVATISVILFLALPDVPYFVCPTSFLGKLYSNTLLVTMNNRLFFRRNASRGEIISSFDAGGPPQIVHLKPAKKFSSSDSEPSNFASTDTYYSG